LWVFVWVIWVFGLENCTKNTWILILLRWILTTFNKYNICRRYTPILVCITLRMKLCWMTDRLWCFLSSTFSKITNNDQSQLISTHDYSLSKALDTLEDLGSSILSYCLQVIKGVFYYVPKKSQIFCWSQRQILIWTLFCPIDRL
jgi:hypothetical protein